VDTATLELNGDALLLDDLDGGYVCTSIDLGWPEPRVVSAGRPLVDGTIDTTERFGARAVSLTLAALDTEAQTWKTTLARLARFLHASARPDLVLNLDGVDYRLGLAPDTAGAVFNAPAHSNVQLQFRAADPFCYGAPTSVSTVASTPGTLGRTYPWTPPRVYPVTDEIPGIVDAVNAGTAPAWPIVTIWGPMTSAGFTLENQTTGDVFSLAATTIESGHSIIIDMRERTVRYDGNPELSRFQLVNFTTSTWLRLMPGTNLIRFATTSPSVALAVIEWADPYLWPGGIAP
jgi:Phage tail protein